MARCGALRLLNGGGLDQCLEVPVDRLFLGVVQLGKGAQKHYRSGDVLIGPSELWGIVPPVDDVALNLAGVTLGAARRVTRMGHSVLCLARRHRWWLVLPPLSYLLVVLLCTREGLRTRVRRVMGL